MTGQKKLDSPDREKIAEKLYQQRWYGGQPTWEKSLLRELFRNYADQILAIKGLAVLDDDQSREEIEGVLGYIEDMFPELNTTYWQSKRWKEFKDEQTKG
ncbi:hypothetical protein LCGC14_0384750 [marine sediment metagenome]|uniref:Uncharacterized protein n=1 Tax=marine sediment metagenome TaxID=412755 RepID=A0A0F9WA37_9ZZZZ